jgi:hypothetical protein
MFFFNAAAFATDSEGISNQTPLERHTHLLIEVICATLKKLHFLTGGSVRYAVGMDADNNNALDALVTKTEKWLKSAGATILERNRDDEDITAAFVVQTSTDLTSSLLEADLPGKVEIEPLD